ncbi:MAG: P-II family nitrogen regulator [Acidobacteria bacterium]|nr:P-II family nitrogen regulator [Acidobacteriota bacterium]
MFEVKAIVRVDRQTEVIAALHEIPGLPGLTLSLVEGIGRRHPMQQDFGRVVMAKLEIVLTDEHLTQVVDALKRSAHTGRPGDGKVFVRRVDQVIRLQTGETGLDALR